MQRIMIIGPGNAGKSTLALQLGEKLNLPVYHLDKYFWNSNWQQKNSSVWHAEHTALVKQTNWVIEGNFSKLFDERAQYSDTIIFLNFPVRILIPRFIHRVFKYRGKTRPDMTEGNTERVNMDYLRWLYRYDRNKGLNLINKYRDNKQTYILGSKKEVKEFLSNIDSPK